MKKVEFGYIITVIICIMMVHRSKQDAAYPLHLILYNAENVQ